MAKREKWSEEELKASVETYAEMYIAEEEGRRVNKAQMYRELEASFGRVNKAFERRMQNISYVVTTLGGNWVKGLKPLSNVGPSTEPVLRRLIKENGFLEAGKPLQVDTTGPLSVEDSDQRALQLLKDWSRSDREILPPQGFERVEEYKTESTHRKRCPEVKAWVLRNANGSCECCGARAPFYKDNGVPYLEVHHVVQLANNGPDTTENAVAVCPNCHRALHLALDRNSMANRLYKDVKRLRKPSPSQHTKAWLASWTNSEEICPEIYVQSSSAMIRKAVSQSLLMLELKPQFFQFLTKLPTVLVTAN